MEMSFNLCVSSEESNDESNDKTVSITTKRKRRTRNWCMSSTYDTKEEAVNAVKTETIWSYHYESVTSDGRKAYYRCNAAKKRGPQCDAGLHILYCINRTDAIIFRTEEGHTHEGLKVNTVKLNDDINNKIQSLFDLKVQPRLQKNLLKSPICDEADDFVNGYADNTTCTDIRQKKKSIVTEHYIPEEVMLKQEDCLSEERECFANVNNYNKHDGEQIFGDYVAEKLRHFPQQIKDEVQLKIERVLLEATEAKIESYYHVNNK